MNRVGRIGRLLLLTGIGLGASCGGTTPNPNTASAAHEGRSARKKPEGENVPFTLPYEVPKLHLLPDVEGSRGLITRSAEGENRLLGRMRLHTTEAGVIERADDLLPAGDVRALKLPTRLGGGFMFIAVADRGTELWRAETWLAPLTPIAALGSNIDARRPIVLGFDRLYVRTRQSEVVGIDPTVPGGALVGLGSLPVAPGYGDMVFLDGWRAVVDTDLAGTFATFDAGATWRKLNLASRVRMISPSSEDADDGDEALISVDGGVYTLTADGHLTFTQGANDGDSGMMVGTFGTDTKGTPPGVLGRKPLRVALEKGYPDSATSAVVLHEGAVVRVSLEDGAILDSKLHAYPEEHADCTGIALGADSADPADDVGFVCGEEHGGTVIYAYERPTGVREVMRFSTPRSVVESGQGAIVVRGPCTDREPEATVRPFCVRFVDGTTREVRVRGDVGAERVIALEDGRVVILVPPRPGAQGQISILEGQASKHVVLKLPDTGVPREFETGMWVDGFQQSAKDEIAGWVEAGGPAFGVRIKLDGTVALGEFVDEPNGILFAGRFSVAIGDRGHVRHSVDFGSTWQDIELPSVDDGSTPARTRRCSAMGCALPGWLQVGWGESAHADDLREAESPSTLKISTMKLSGAPLELSCSSVKSDKPPKTTGKIGEGQALTSWQAFRGVDPPLLDKEDVGVDNGSTYDANLVRFYVWGKRESDWSRTGRFIVRYADKYALEEVRSSAVTGSPWSSQGIASEALGMGAYSYGGAQWSTQRDLSAVLVGLCRPGVRACSLFAVEPDQPVLTLRPTEGVTLVRPFNNGAVRLGHVWFFLGDVGVSDQIGLYRADLGVVRLVGTFSRLPAGRFTAPVLPRLVRRQSGDQLGFMFVQREGPQDKRGSRWILPIDPETAAVGEAIRIGRPDFGDMDLTAPCGARDGWLAEIPTEQAPDFTLDGSSGRLDATEVRVRLEPGSACVEAAVGTVSSIFSDDPKAAKKEKAGASASAIPVVALDRSTNTRRELACTVTPKAKKR